MSLDPLWPMPRYQATPYHGNDILAKTANATGMHVSTVSKTLHHNVKESNDILCSHRVSQQHLVLSWYRHPHVLESADSFISKQGWSEMESGDEAGRSF